jgi:hypothetical protein
MFNRGFFTFVLMVMVLHAHAADDTDQLPVEPAKLAALIKRADKIVVSTSPLKGEKGLFTSKLPKDIDEFNDALSIAPPKEWFHCMCIGTPAIRLFEGKTELALITGHHGISVRCSLWSSDAVLKDPEKWLQWFDARKMPEPRKEFEEMTTRAKQNELSYERWLSAMPKSIRPLWEEAAGDGTSPKVELLRPAVISEFPDNRQRGLALLAWYGSGEGPWSGYPSYESAAEQLLLDIPTPDLVVAAQNEHLTDSQLEGAARLFAGWSFFKQRPDDRSTLPATLKQRLLDHSLKSTNKDKKARAKKAFAQKDPPSQQQ